jgi:hypothetical protein
MIVQGDARQAIVLQFITDYHVGVYLIAGPGCEEANSRTGSWDLKPIVNRLVLGDCVAVDPRRARLPSPPRIQQRRQEL